MVVAIAAIVAGNVAMGVMGARDERQDDVAATAPMSAAGGYAAGDDEAGRAAGAQEGQDGQGGATGADAADEGDDDGTAAGAQEVVGDEGYAYQHEAAQVSGTVDLLGQHAYERVGGSRRLAVTQDMTVDVDRVGGLLDEWADAVGVQGDVTLLYSSEFEGRSQYAASGLVPGEATARYCVVVTDPAGRSWTYHDADATDAMGVMDGTDMLAYMGDADQVAGGTGDGAA